MGQYYGFYSLPLGDVLVIAGLLLAFVGLVNTEQVVRLTPGALSTELRTCLAGMGGLFAYDLFLYSQAQLLGELDGVAWALRGLLAAVMLVPFTWGIWKMPKSEVRVFVSRHVVFYSSAFVAVGDCTCRSWPLGGYYVREHGGSWGNALQIVFLCGAAAILVSLLLVRVAAAPAARLHLDTFLSQQVRLPHRVAAIHRHAVVERTTKTCAARPCARWRRSSRARAASCSCATSRPGNSSRVAAWP